MVSICFGIRIKGYHIGIQIMNVYECNGTNIFMRWKMKCSIQRGEAELNGTFHLHRMKIFVPLHEWKKHSLFVLYNTKIDPCHLTSDSHWHCTLSFSLPLQFHRYPILKQSRVQPSQKFSNSESSKVCLENTSKVKYLRSVIFPVSMNLQMQYTVIYDCWFWQSWQNLAPLTVCFEACTHCCFDSWFSKDFDYHFNVKYSWRMLNHEI